MYEALLQHMNAVLVRPSELSHFILVRFMCVTCHDTKTLPVALIIEPCMDKPDGFQQSTREYVGQCDDAGLRTLWISPRATRLPSQSSAFIP